ncbi:MAG: zinc-ribbon domain-containing protein, partial [Myxococcota bacterium]
MKIVCENCRRSYTIDDAQLSDQPIGAQCPFCTHVEMVTRPAPAPTSTADQLGFRSSGDADAQPSSSLDLGLGPESSRAAPSAPQWTGERGGPSSSLDLGSSFDLEAPPSAPRDPGADL